MQYLVRAYTLHGPVAYTVKGLGAAKRTGRKLGPIDGTTITGGSGRKWTLRQAEDESWHWQEALWRGTAPSGEEHEPNTETGIPDDIPPTVHGFGVAEDEIR